MRKLRYYLPLFLAAFATLAIMSVFAAEDTLEIFGNANMDDTINADDETYVQGIINGTNEPTEFADANYDGTVDEKDIENIRQIIAGEEKNLTIMQTITPHSSPSATREPVTVSLPIKSIAALTGTYGPEMLCALGEEDKIVAIVSDVKKRGELRAFVNDTPEVGKTTEWDMEKILTLKPDIVLAYAIYDYSKERKILQEAGIPLVQLNFHVPETYKNETRKLGWMLNKRERVEELIDFEQEHIDFIKDRVKDLKDEEKPRVFGESYKDLQTGSGNSVSRAIEPCGGINIFKEINDTKEIDPEEVLKKNPQVIIKMTFLTYIPQSGYDAVNDSQMAAKVKDIMNRPGWENIDAVKNSRVYILSSDAASLHPSVFNTYVAKWLHPELFEDMDPVAIHNEWLEKFLGEDFKGVYGYPLLEVK
ncbi:MAG TPA: ABC transporter substrate-binding protein [Methanothrix sp.]|nr:ABC transporter substrate-binding protein [Methanothrix sp.]